jgi:hypothetical protein
VFTSPIEGRTGDHIEKVYRKGAALLEGKAREAVSVFMRHFTISAIGLRQSLNRHAICNESGGLTVVIGSARQ